jgi:hypothetical protein
MVAALVTEEIERKGLKPIKGEEGKKYYSTVVSEIVKFPWDEEKSSGKSASKGKSAAKSTAKKTTGAKGTGNAKSTAKKKGSGGGGGEEIQEEAMAVVMEILAEKGGSCSKAALAGAVFKATKGSENRAAIVKLCNNADFLGDEEMPWEYEGNTLTIPE